MSAPPTTETVPVNRATNYELGELIGLSHSSVSRLRSGERGTSTTVMMKIEEVFGWGLHDQIARRDNGTYATELERLASEWKSAQLAKKRG